MASALGPGLGRETLVPTAFNRARPSHFSRLHNPLQAGHACRPLRGPSSCHLAHPDPHLWQQQGALPPRQNSETPSISLGPHGTPSSTTPGRLREEARAGGDTKSAQAERGLQTRAPASATAGSAPRPARLSLKDSAAPIHYFKPRHNYIYL